MINFKAAKTRHTEILKTSVNQNLAINTGFKIVTIDEKIQQCPAQDKTNLKCYALSYWDAKPGRSMICIRPCKYENEIKGWNKRHGN